MPITDFGRAQVKLVADEAVAALQVVAMKYGLAVKYNGGNFTSTSAVIKIEFAVKASNGQAATREIEAFKRFTHRYGLKPEDLGKTFSLNGRHYAISGINSNAVKMPILATDLRTGKVFTLWAEFEATGRFDSKPSM